MTHSFFRIFSVFRPDDDVPPEQRTRVQIHRLLSLLGVILVPLFGPLYALSNPEATDPEWARFAVAGLFAVLLAVSYGSRWIRRNYVLWMRGVLYILMAWFAAVTALNGFAGNYAVGLLLVYAVLTVVVGLGAHTLGPVLRFLAFGLLLTIGGAILTPTLHTSLPILLLSMVTMGIVGSIVIQAQLSMRKELRAAKEEAEEASRLKSAVLANMSHEIRTPLTSIIGFAEAIGDELAGEEGPASRFAHLIERSGHRLLETLDAVLNLSKLEAREAGLSAEPVDLTLHGRQIIEEFRSEAEASGVDLRTNFESPSAVARADENGIEIVLRNLISNAVKYTEEGGEVSLQIREERNAVVLAVQDTGIGMAEEEVSQLFQAFRQESEGLSREYEGSGLGLTVTQRTVERMGGSIDVETEKGKGSRFTVRLPKADREEMVVA